MKIKKLIPFGLLPLVLCLLATSCEKDEDNDKKTEKKAVNLYYTDWAASKIGKIDLIDDPNDAVTLFNSSDGIAGPAGIVLTEDGYLIVSDDEADCILKMKKDGTGEIEVLYDDSDGVNEPDGMAYDKQTGAIFWCNSGTYQIMKGSSDGSQPVQTLYGGDDVIEYAYGMAIDKTNNKLYIGDFYLGILYGNLDGSGTLSVLYNSANYPDLSAPSNVFVRPSEEKIYWADEDAYDIVSASLDGTGTPDVLFDSSDGVNRPDGIYVDHIDDMIYWSETNSNVIARGNLDGSGDREVLVEDVESYCIILEFDDI